MDTTITMSMMAKHYNSIFDETQSTFVLKLRKKTVMQLLRLMNTWEKSGALDFMMSDIFDPLFLEISSAQSEDEIQGILDKIEKIGNQ